MSRNRDDFTEEIKRKLGDRVAWKCSFPGCDNVTIGPGNEDVERVIKLGNAAHITAASTKGPRYDSSLAQEERRSIENGIWMCNAHATLIDRDEYNYSAATLRQWKKIAEEKAYNALKNIQNEELSIPSTLVSIGNSIIFDGVWKSVEDDLWGFEVNEFMVGDARKLEYLSTKEQSDDFVIVESQGDGRVLSDKLRWKFEKGRYHLYLKVCKKTKREDPDLLYDFGIELESDGEKFNPDLKVNRIGNNIELGFVNGSDYVKQAVAFCLSVGMGEVLVSPFNGSYFSEYFWKFYGNEMLLNRFLKLEIARLISIPIYGPYAKILNPPLGFINRVVDARILNMKCESGFILIQLRLELGNGKMWKDDLKIFIRPKEQEKEIS